MSEHEEQIRSAEHILGQLRHHLGSAKMLAEYCADTVIWAAARGTGATLGAAVTAQAAADNLIPTLQLGVQQTEQLIKDLKEVAIE